MNVLVGCEWRFILLLTLLALLGGAPAKSSAQNRASRPRTAEIERAKRAFVEGTTAYERGDFQASLAQFRTAYELTGSPDLLYNIATVADRLRHDDEALAAYEGYLEARPSTADRGHVEGRIKALRASIDARVRAAQAAEVEAERLAKEAVARDRKARDEAAYIDPGAGPWITLGGSAASSAAGAILLGLGVKNRRVVQNAEPGTLYKDIEDNLHSAPRLTRAGAVMLGLGLAGATAAVVWEIKGARMEKTPSLAVGPGRIAIHGRF